MEREKLNSRLGFILLSAGCAIGIGNVWRFPYVVGSYGGGIFVLFYIFFLVILGVPVMTMEFAVGRASKKSTSRSFKVLQKEGQKWHWQGYAGMIGNYVLMMFYTTVAGWMILYFYYMISGRFTGLNTQQVQEVYISMLQRPGLMILGMAIVVLVGFFICSIGLQNGVEKITKYLMMALLVIMVVLAINSITLENSSEGLKFYLVPNLESMKEIGLSNILLAAMNQAFFTLSLGIGAMAIFGSYLSDERALLGEAVNIAILDTFVAIVAGLIIFPACFAYGVNPDSGPSLIFITLPNIFNAMPGGRVWGSFFFIFMLFAAFSTVLGVFENIMSSCIDIWGWTRKKAAIINTVLVTLLSIPCILGFNLWSGFNPLGANTNIMDLEDFIVSNILLPVGALVYTLFCVSKRGWGWDNYINEANKGKGMKIKQSLRGYSTWVLPLIIIVVILNGLYSVFFS